MLQLCLYDLPTVPEAVGRCVSCLSLLALLMSAAGAHFPHDHQPTQGLCESNVGSKPIVAICAGSKGSSAFEQLDAQGPAVLAALQGEWAAANASAGSPQEARASPHASTSSVYAALYLSAEQ